ncbi:hypothetical protein QQF64_008023 [Cirrhinus molitorella]|uniref:Uncharacterized protein n=1 Tax=Cirrhinus molitorella TaxID=172907 RepID=A0ABR3M4Y4_9TELE
MEVAILLLRASALVPPKFCLFCCCGLLLSHGGLKLHPTLGISGPICSAMVAISSALMASYFASSSLDSSSTLVTSSCGSSEGGFLLSRLAAGEPPGCFEAAEIRHDLHRGRSPFARVWSFNLEPCSVSPPYKHVLRATSPAEKMTDYREDGMDLGSDSSSRSSSESNSNKVTPCSEYKSSPSLELAGLEDYEEDEDYQQYKKRALVDWEREYGGSYADNQHQDFRQASPLHASVNSRSLAEELQSAKAPTSSLLGHAATSEPEELKQNGNSILPCERKTLGKPSLGSGVMGREVRGGIGLGSYREECVDESQLPPMDWAALERHLAGLQFREQQNHNHGLIRTNSTNVSPHECLMLLESMLS